MRDERHMSARVEERQGAGGPPRSIGGITIVAALVLGVAVWMSLQRPQLESAGDMRMLIFVVAGVDMKNLRDVVS